MSSQAVTNICDLTLIYNQENNYSLPKCILEDFLHGKAFGRSEPYTKNELENLVQDINDLYQKIISKTQIQKLKLAIITAGAPGAGKTIKLNQDLELNRSNEGSFAYVCPDDVCLKEMKRTFVKDMTNTDGSKEARLEAYNKWRPGSNAAAHIILANLIKNENPFYFGSTSSGPATYKSFEALKNQGYEIKLIHVSASDEVRWESIQERDQTFIQTTEEDVKEKGLLVPQRINDTFLKYADKIEFYYRDEVKKDALLAAVWIKNKESSSQKGTLEIIEKTAYEKIKTIHDTTARILQRNDLFWEKAVEDNSEIKCLPH
ncbi:MAG: zeta toxin family protein [Rhabdochlamydiaceae bacterium]